MSAATRTRRWRRSSGRRSQCTSRGTRRGADRAGRAGDQDAIAAHLDALAAYPEARDLYVHLTRAMESLLATRPIAGDSGARVA